MIKVAINGFGRIGRMNRHTELASRFVDVENLSWEKTAYAGIEQKTLLVDKQTGLITALMRMSNGLSSPLCFLRICVDKFHFLIETWSQ